MFALTVAMLAAASPGGGTYSVLIARRVGMPQADGIEVAEAFGRYLEAGQGRSLGTQLGARALAVTLTASANTPDSAGCAGANDCLIALGRVGKLDELVALQVVKVGKNLAVDVTILDVATGAVRGTATGSVPAVRPYKELEPLAAQLMISWAATPAPVTATPPEPVAAEEPPAAKPPEPAPVAAAVVAPEAQPPARSSARVWSVVPALVFAGAAAVATYFFLTANGHATALRNGDRAVVGPDPVRYASEGGQQQTIGFALTGVAGAGLIAAAVLFLAL
jgi:hypothetical protein